MTGIARYAVFGLLGVCRTQKHGQEEAGWPRVGRGRQTPSEQPVAFHQPGWCFPSASCVLSTAWGPGDTSEQGVHGATGPVEGTVSC